MHRGPEAKGPKTGPGPRAGASLWLWPVVLSACLSSGCDSAFIQGQVFTIRGETLPGVAVTVAGTEYNALTNVLGRYRLPVVPGKTVLTFAKTGYTPGVLELVIRGRRRVNAADVRLWHLPPTAGVYLFEDFRYRGTTWIEPKRMIRKDGKLVYGTQRRPEYESRTPEPLVVVYKMPRYNVRLSTLVLAKARINPSDAQLTEAWIVGETMETNLEPIDRAEGMLLQISLTGPLAPGTYAVHWGAFTGYDTLEHRAFLFSVGSPEIVQPVPAEGEGDGMDRP